MASSAVYDDDANMEKVVLASSYIIAPGKPEILKSDIPIWDQHVYFEPVYAEQLMCSSYFGILLIPSFSGRDQAACKTRMSTTPPILRS